ncbi:homoserine dehydrogenase [Desulforhabdus amnigena]|uniref:Homoserine dehydrogenase n=1 Tax=Desulforhabdus amnigena TaxID=40218 RepID=A0A9W6D255_9BACT|nr:homoserine dehydrogenase [Desulforhabdus amnigena]NLJ28597.1 homoserine dehydrogenase [Deltaproteobacteria bacterium]GLI33868.1 homoserine dehydrogenase [Desulforhabdus amnigena]
MRAIGIGLIGWGTVGCGVIQTLRDNAEAIENRLGIPLKLLKVADLDLDRPRPVDVPRELLTTRVEDIMNDPDIHIVVELMGGLGAAKTFIKQALENKKYVVTANKALLAHDGNELFEVARRNGRSIGFEASVGGGIPIIKSLREGLAGNRIDTLFGILNGTANYILTRMTEGGLSFGDALREAQAKGYAEADPALDIEGTDTAHKLAIASAISFGTPIQFDSVYTEGISGIAPLDVQFGEEFGYCLKLLAIARNTDGRIEMRVHPTFIPRDHILAGVSGAYNAVHIHGNSVGNIMLYGMGAGMLPTGSAVVADLMDIARDILANTPERIAPLAFLPERLSLIPIKPISDISTCYYFRFSAVDRPGVLSKISGILGANEISISAVIQKGRQTEGSVPIVMVTHEAVEANVRKALKEIDELNVVLAPTQTIRIENQETTHRD